MEDRWPDAKFIRPSDFEALGQIQNPFGGTGLIECFVDGEPSCAIASRRKREDGSLEITPLFVRLTQRMVLLSMKEAEAIGSLIGPTPTEEKPKPAEKKPRVVSEYFAAVRKTEGREWISSGEIKALAEEARTAAAEMDARIPTWAKANPVQRIVRVKVVEE